MDEITSKKLNELIEKRQKLVAALKENGDRSHELLAEGLYKKRTHFITELLQNAEDEGANHISFTLNENELVFTHDASHPFDFDDIKSISNFGDNEKKKDKPNAIGRFGIGFKSVYSITDTPRIISGDFDITIKEMCIPEKNSLQTDYYCETKIVLPLRKTETENIVDRLDAEFQNLDILCLLFLSNIKVIEWHTPNGNGKYEKIIDNKNQIVALMSDTKSDYFIVFDKKVNIDDKELTAKIAFSLNASKSTIVPCEKSPLFAFFPMSSMETNLNFLIHAPFHTTETRDTLDETDKRNDILLNELGVLLAEKLPVLKNCNFITVDFLNMLPIDKDICSRSAVYAILYESTKREFQKDTNEFIPTIEKNVYCSVKEAMLLGSAELSELLTGKQAKALLGREKWITSDITEAKTETKKLYYYLSSTLGIPDYDLRKFATNLTEEFLRNQSNNWFKEKFYRTVYQKAAGLWEKDAKNPVLRKRHIIRVKEQGKYSQIMPFADDGKPIVYLPTDSKTKYRTVLCSIANDKIVSEFLKALGLDYPDVFAEISEFILPNFKKSEMYEGYFDDLAAIVEAPQDKNEKYNRLISDLKNCDFILGENHITHEQKLLRWDEIYFPSEVLTQYFENNSDVYFVVLIDKFDEGKQEKYKKLLLELGVENNTPRRIKIDNFLTDKKKRKIASIPDNHKFSFFYDYDLEGLEKYIKNITFERSILLWRILISQNADFFKGETEYYYRYDYQYKKTFDTKFLRELRNSKWLFIDEKCLAPHEIIFDELHEEYRIDVIRAKDFSSLLNFKLDEDKEYERAHKGKKIVSEDELEKLRADSEELQRIKAEKEAADAVKKSEFDNKPEFKPSVNPADAPIRSSSYNPADTARPYDGHQTGLPNDAVAGNNSENSGNPGVSGNNSQNDANNSSDNSDLLKDVGKWGENYIACVLHDEFKEQSNITIIDLNAEGKTGVGADFEIRKDDKLIKFVEVKTTTGPEGSPVVVSGTQWETARSFFNIDDGDIYWIYCVYNAGEPNVQYVPVQNPIKLWKEGKVIANPVNFIVRSIIDSNV